MLQGGYAHLLQIVESEGTLGPHQSYAGHATQGTYALNKAGDEWARENYVLDKWAFKEVAMTNRMRKGTCIYMLIK